MTRIGKLVSKLITSTAISWFCVSAYAENLTQVFEHALLNDATFRKAQSDWNTTRMNLPLALTGNGQVGTGLFPNILVSGSLIPWYFQQQSNHFGISKDTFTQNTLTINVDQPLFNVATWMAISSARYTVKAAMARYLAAAQDLMNRTAFAYFEVLRAQDTLTLRLAQEKQFLNQLVTSEEKFKVGLIAITGVYNAQASYDRAVAQEITDRNNLHDKLENLRAITGRLYRELNGLKAIIPLLIPKPRDMETWVKVAIRQNYVLQFDLNTMYASRQNVKVAATANIPTFDFTGQYQVQTTGGVFAPIQSSGFVLPRTTIKTAYAGFSMNFPVFRGGYDIANVKSNQYKYLSASDQLEMDYRDVMNKTRQAYLGIDSGIYTIQATAEAILSARNQLEATEAGYVVGTRTMVDVLDAVTTLTQNQLAYADSRYDYIESIFNLKLSAGTLSPIDIKKINCWLAGPIVFQLRQDVGKIKSLGPKKYPPVNLLQLNQPKFTTPPGEGLPNVGGDRAPSRLPSTPSGSLPQPLPIYTSPSTISPSTNYPPAAPRPLRGNVPSPVPTPGTTSRPTPASPSITAPSSSPSTPSLNMPTPRAAPTVPSASPSSMNQGMPVLPTHTRDHSPEHPVMPSPSKVVADTHVNVIHPAANPAVIEKENQAPKGGKASVLILDKKPRDHASPPAPKATPVVNGHKWVSVIDSTKNPPVNEAKTSATVDHTNHTKTPMVKDKNGHIVEEKTSTTNEAKPPSAIAHPKPPATSTPTLNAPKSVPVVKPSKLNQENKPSSTIIEPTKPTEVVKPQSKNTITKHKKTQHKVMVKHEQLEIPKPAMTMPPSKKVTWHQARKGIDDHATAAHSMRVAATVDKETEVKPIKAPIHIETPKTPKAVSHPAPPATPTTPTLNTPKTVPVSKPSKLNQPNKPASTIIEPAKTKGVSKPQSTETPKTEKSNHKLKKTLVEHETLEIPKPAMTAHKSKKVAKIAKISQPTVIAKKSSDTDLLPAPKVTTSIHKKNKTPN